MTLSYVPKELRSRRSGKTTSYVLKRDRGICQCCCKEVPRPEVHHILPIMFGGEDHPNNAISLCPDCHIFAPNDPEEFLQYQKDGGIGFKISLYKLLQADLMIGSDCSLQEFWEDAMEFRIRLFVTAWNNYDGRFGYL